jgi:hypothetical protein
MGGVFGSLLTPPLSVSASGWRAAAELWDGKDVLISGGKTEGRCSVGEATGQYWEGARAGQAQAGKIRFVACLGGAWRVVGWWRARGRARAEDV